MDYRPQATIRIDVGDIELKVNDSEDVGHPSQNDSGLPCFSMNLLETWVNDTLAPKYRATKFLKVAGDESLRHDEHYWVLAAASTIAVAKWENCENIREHNFSSMPLRSVALERIAQNLELPTLGYAGWQFGTVWA